MGARTLSDDLEWEQSPTGGLCNVEIGTYASIVFIFGVGFCLLKIFGVARVGTIPFYYLFISFCMISATLRLKTKIHAHGLNGTYESFDSVLRRNLTIHKYSAFAI